jgi:amino acid adenylation domain-containing protein
MKEDVSVFPTSFAQQRLWFLDQLEPGLTAYNMSAAYRITGRLNVRALEQSLNEIVRRHEALRTTFASRDGQPVQIIATSSDLALSIIDLSDLSKGEREAEASRLVIEDAQQPFDITREVLRAPLLRLGAEEHVLALYAHHIAFDGWSWGVFYRELAALYDAFTQGKPSSLPELPIQYADFAIWQRQWLQGETLEAQLAYWEQQLRGASNLSLPTDRKRPAVQTYHGARRSLGLSPALAKGLKALSRREGATLFMTLLAAFKVLLYRYSGQTDILVGSPIANRNRTEIEGLIGFFVNTLVLRSDLSGQPSFRELLAQVREVSFQAYMHQDLPFDKLVQELNPERDMSRNPLFQVLFAFQNAPRHPFQLTGLSVTRWPLATTTTHFDLQLHLMEEAATLEGFFLYNTDLFEADTIARMSTHFQTLVQAIVADPNTPISHLPLLTEVERHQLLVEWNSTTVARPPGFCVHQLCENQVEQTPQAIAVECEEQQLTYRQLDSRANQMAHYLRRQGAGVETRVGIFVERSLEMAVSVLAVLKAGAAYVPLDPAYPSQRLAFMIEDAGLSVILSQEDLLRQLPKHSAQVICLDADWPRIASESSDKPPAVATPDSLAYVLYTSGSTGWPKGVAMPHRALTNRILWQMEHTALRKACRTLQFNSLSFDVSFTDLFLPWCSGGTTVIATEEVRSDLGSLAKFIIEQSIERIDLPFVALHHLALAFDEQPEPPACLKEVISTAEPLQIGPELRNLFRRLPGCSLRNQYGPTETHVVTALDLAAAPESWPVLPAIGRPITNAQVYLLDSNLLPVPIGVPGELYIGGDCLARGYLNRPDLTAEKFIPHPFSTEPGARLYRTGDLARYRPDGNVEFLGRRDHQVKIRGFRVELGEIETAIGQLPEVREAVVTAPGDSSLGRALVAYLVLEHGASFSTREARELLKQRLPVHMVPSAFVLLEALPLTPSGKVNRQALPTPDKARPELDEAYAPPNSDTERALAAMWAQVLGLEQIGVHDNFFELGGHSLLATQVASRLRATFQVELPLRSLFETPTIAGLVSTLEKTRQADTGLQAPAISPVSRESRRVPGSRTANRALHEEGQGS